MLCSHWLDELRLRLSPFRNGRRRAGGRDSRLTDLRRAAEILEDRTLLTVTSHFDAMSGVLSINADGFDNVAITGSGGNVLINGENPDSGAQVASAIIQIDVTAVGEFANTLDASGVTVAAGFTSPFLSLRLAAGEGNDTVELNRFAG
jgi:hypothetical protein